MTVSNFTLAASPIKKNTLNINAEKEYILSRASKMIANALFCNICSMTTMLNIEMDDNDFSARHLQHCQAEGTS
jgi:hypothetical protein